MKLTWRRMLALLLAFAFVAAACSGDEGDDEATEAGTEETETSEAEDEEAMEDDEEAMEDDEEAMEDDAMEDDAMVDISGTTVVVTGPERDEVEGGSIQKALDVFAAENDMTITYTGSADWESEVNVQVEAGSPPDISYFPQPGKLADFYRNGDLIALPEHTAGITAANWSDAWTVFGNVDGDQVGIPIKNDLKSLVWYKPARFEELGYEIPETFDAFVALVETAIADGNAPLCVGVESGQATGWLYTDWVEEMILRFEGADFYDQWVAHEVPFDDERVVAQMQAVLDLWNTPDAVFAAGGTITSSHHSRDGSQGIVDNDCLMQRQASFAAGQFPEGTAFADPADPEAIDAFYFPSNEGRPLLGAGVLAASFADRPEVWAVMEYISGPEYAAARQGFQKEAAGGGNSGFLSAVNGLDQSVFNGLEQSFLAILADADVVRFDGSDLMPADVGAGTFWTEGTSAINGEQDAAEAAAKIEASWP